MIILYTKKLTLLTPLPFLGDCILVLMSVSGTSRSYFLAHPGKVTRNPLLVWFMITALAQQPQLSRASM